MLSIPHRAEGSSSVRALKERLSTLVGGAVSEEVRGMPGEWGNRLAEAVPFRQLWHLSLLSCASAQWCGAPPEKGLHASAAVLFLAGATASHAVPAVGVTMPCMDGYDAGGPPEAGRILAGDALLPLAVKVIGGLDTPVSLVLADLLLKSASEMIETMSFGRHADMTGRWAGRLSGLAARMGAVSSGAPAAAAETAALAGMEIGKAAAILHLTPARDAMQEAGAMLKDAMTSLRPGNAGLFGEICGFVSAMGTGEPDSLFFGFEPD